jgi:glycosyltransferase involved in cell wall biosynthesis
LLGSTHEEVAAHLHTLLGDDELRRSMSDAAAARAARFTWDATARGVLDVLADEMRRVGPR